ncbi:MAG: hypothetical protein ACR2MC_02775, partial [Actinomycetota bacterium]
AAIASALVTGTPSYVLVGSRSQPCPLDSVDAAAELSGGPHGLGSRPPPATNDTLRAIEAPVPFTLPDA